MAGCGLVFVDVIDATNDSEWKANSWKKKNPTCHRKQDGKINLKLIKYPS